MEKLLNHLNAPYNQIKFYLYIIKLRTKEAVEGITPSHLILLVFAIIFASISFKGKDSFQVISLFLRFTALAIILFFVMVISSQVLPPTIIKKEISKWDSKYFSDNFIFLILQIVLGIHAYYFAQTYDKPLFELFFVSFLLSVIGLFLIKFYIRLRWGRKR